MDPYNRYYNGAYSPSGSNHYPNSAYPQNCPLPFPSTNPPAPQGQQVLMFMRIIGLVITCILPIPHLPLWLITLPLILLQWGGHPLHLCPKVCILTPIRRVFIMIAHTTSTTIKLLIPILNFIIHHLWCILKLITKVAACQTITLRLLMSKQMLPPARLQRHRCTHWMT